MGHILNPGNYSFWEATVSQIYLDKTEMISYLNSVVRTRQKYVCVSRPRRFGKTMAADMLCAYYGWGADSRALFQNKKLGKQAQWDRYLGKFDVIRLAMTEWMQSGKTVPSLLERIAKLVTRELSRAYPDVDYFDTTDFMQSMSDVYGHTGRQFVVIIDEWDALFREFKEDQEGQRHYLNFLRSWLKDQEYVALAYLTGILPIKKYGVHSALNMFDEYSMLSPMQLAPYTGFTEEEVRPLCQQYRMRYTDIKDWYDGYSVSRWQQAKDRNGRGGPAQDGNVQAVPLEPRLSLYNPLSIVNALRNGVIQNYWNQTETYEALERYISGNYDGLREDIIRLMDGARIKIDISGYQNDMTTFGGKDDILTMLIHLGYLGYDSGSKEVFIPNKEILDVYKTSTRSRAWTASFRALENSQKLLEATWAGDAETVARLIEAAHDQTGNRTYNSEAALSYAIQLAYYQARNYYTLIQEMDTGKGYADLVYLPAPEHLEKPALLVELKYAKDADSAMDQIRRQRYPDNLAHYKGNLILVGINYDRTAKNGTEEFKHHSCVIVRA